MLLLLRLISIYSNDSREERARSTQVELDSHMLNFTLQLSVHGSDPYHRDCYKKLFHPKCEICYNHVRSTFTIVIWCDHGFQTDRQYLFILFKLIHFTDSSVNSRLERMLLP